jgi:hypothetical protein
LSRKYVVDFPTLFVVPAWIKRHVQISDGFRKGQPFRMYDWQLWVTLNHFRVKEEAEQSQDWAAGDPEAYPVRSKAFYYRRTQVIAPQKTGKGPWSAALVCAEAVGPVLFLGWAIEGDVYRCSDHGCSCGWVYRYRPGEAMGHPWATPLIQLLATSEDQVDNVYKHLRVMAKAPRLRAMLKVREGFVRIIREGVEEGVDDEDSSRIDVVTSSAQSRLGNPITFCLQDETQLYNPVNKMVRVAETMRRGAAAMGGRSIETTNCYDPSEQSVAQRTAESKRPDIFKFYEPPPEKLKYSRKRDRAQIHAYNYAGSPHADLDGIMAEAEELIEKDPGQAERFYGNRIVAGLGTWCSREAWDLRKAKRKRDLVVPDRTAVTVGFDGSDIDDWTGFRCETREGYQFTPCFPDGRPMIWNPADYGGQVPRLDVSAGMDHIMATFLVVRGYFDPPYWETEIDAWAEKYGDDRILRWATYRPRPFTAAADRLLTDVNKKDSTFTHDRCETTAQHIANARKAPRPNGTYALAKPGDGRKIDMAIPSILAHEAHGDVTAADAWPVDAVEMVYIF